MVEWVQSVMTGLGYVGIALLLLLECLFPPIPSEIIIPLAGFTAAQGQLDFIGVCVAATIGSVLGAIILYYVGKLVGTKRLARFTDKYGKWLGVSSKDIMKADDWFDRYGVSVVFFCRFIPGIRSLISIPAGISEMKMFPFLVYTTVGSALWNIALAYAGLVLGQNYHIVGDYIDPVSKIVLVAVAVGFVGWLGWRFIQVRIRNKNKQVSEKTIAKR